MGRWLTERRLSNVASRLKSLRAELAIIDEQLLYLGDDADDQAIRAPSRDWLARRYLGAAERDAMSSSRTPRQYLNARIAANDAVRSLCWESGAGPLFPVQAPQTGVFVATAAVACTGAMLHAGAEAAEA